MVDELDINALLRPEHQTSASEKERLTLLKDQYPWSEIIQISYLKALKDSKDLKFSDELSRVAALTQDRARLYAYLYGAQLQSTIEKVESEMAALPEADGLIPPNWKKLEEDRTSQLTPVEEAPSLIDAETPPIHIASDNTEEEQIDPAEETSVEEEEKDEEIPEIISEEKQTGSARSEELNNLIISEAVDSSIILDVIEDMSASSNPTESINEENKIESQSISSDNFINWLVSNAAAVSYPSFDSTTSVPSSASVTSIIDTFIQNEPQISRGKSKEFGKENLAASSLVDNEEFVTETLAEIYANQGNISKAKRAFQLLSLKYPEKSIYFAARIKQLGRKK